jgi:hypothetical protein
MLAYVKRRQLSCLLVSFGLLGCSAAEQTALAEEQVVQFHRRLNSGDFEGVYDTATNEFKSSARKEDILELLRTVHAKLGLVTETKKLNWNVNYHTSGTFVTIVYETSFQRGKASERFVFRIEAREPKLVSYNVDSLTK